MNTATAKTDVCPDSIPCAICGARGSVGVAGYDFGEIYQATCDACEGRGYLGDIYKVAETIGALRRRAVHAEKDLRELRTNLALYFGTLPNTKAKTADDCKVDPCDLKLEMAPRPSPYPSTWLPYLEQAARLAPRQAAK